MTNIYLVRHCESEGNLIRVFQGHLDTEVSENGKKQLEALSERFRNVHLDALYASPLKRTMATARAINKYHNLDINVTADVIEINGGELEGVHWRDIYEKYPDLAHLWIEDISNFKSKEGDSVADVAKRGYNAIRKIAKENKDKTVAVATHGGFTRFSMSLLSGNTVADIPFIEWPDNTAVTLLQFDDELNCKINCYNDYSHLKGIKVNELWTSVDSKFTYSLSDKWNKKEIKE